MINPKLYNYLKNKDESRQKTLLQYVCNFYLQGLREQKEIEAINIEFDKFISNIDEIKKIYTLDNYLEAIEKNGILIDEVLRKIHILRKNKKMLESIEMELTVLALEKII